jgi:hypothetical protein
VRHRRQWLVADLLLRVADTKNFRLSRVGKFLRIATLEEISFRRWGRLIDLASPGILTLLSRFIYDPDAKSRRGQDELRHDRRRMKMFAMMKSARGWRMPKLAAAAIAGQSCSAE